MEAAKQEGRKGETKTEKEGGSSRTVTGSGERRLDHSSFTPSFLPSDRISVSCGSLNLCHGGELRSVSPPSCPLPLFFPPISIPPSHSHSILSYRILSFLPSLTALLPSSSHSISRLPIQTLPFKNHARPSFHPHSILYLTFPSHSPISIPLRPSLFFYPFRLSLFTLFRHFHSDLPIFSIPSLSIPCRHFPSFPIPFRIFPRWSSVIHDAESSILFWHRWRLLRTWQQPCLHHQRINMSRPIH